MASYSTSSNSKLPYFCSKLVHALNPTVNPNEESSLLEWFMGKSMKFHYVYVLLSEKDGKLYIGSTNDLKRRISEHRQGKNISTAKRLPLELIFYEAYPTKSDAERRERYFKTAKGKTTLKQMLADYLRAV
jgi:putative endonuclease